MSFKINKSKNKKQKNSVNNTNKTSSTTTESPTRGSEDSSSDTSSSYTQTNFELGCNSGITTSTRRNFTRQRVDNPSHEALYKRMERKLIREGYLNVNMLFGYVCAMRETNGLKPYATKCSMINALNRYNLPFKAIKYSGNTVRRWYKRDETAAALCEIRQRDHDAFLSNPATEEEIVSGDWLDVVATERLTGIRRKRISSIGDNHREITRLHPITNARLFHVPSIREYGYWRELSYIRKMYSDIAADALLNFRPQKKYTIGGIIKTLVYCPDLAHL